MDNDRVTVDVTLTADDVYRYQKSVLLEKVPLATYIFLSVLIGICAIVLLFYEADLVRKIVYTGLLAIFPVLFFIVIPFALKHSSKKILESSKLLQKKQSFIISSEGLEVTSDSGKSLIKWDELYKATEVTDSFQFYISNKQAFVIPKKYLDEASVQSELIQTYMKGAPVPKGGKKSLARKFMFGIGIYIIIFIIVLVILVLYQTYG